MTLYIAIGEGRRRKYRVAEPHEVIAALPQYAAEQSRGQTIQSASDSRDLWSLFFRNQPDELFAVCFLNARHRVLHTEALFHGTIDGASVHPRVVVRRCLELNAAALIVAHNHPSGNSEPSRADRALTRRLIDACGLVDVRLLDHFIVTNNAIVSFAERGWL